MKSTDIARLMRIYYAHGIDDACLELGIPSYKAHRIITATLKRNVDKLWGKVIRARGYCSVCGETSQLQAHHLIARTRHRYRYDPRNGICLCFKHHQLDNNISPHASMSSALNFVAFLKKNNPQQYRYFMENREDKRPVAVDYEKLYVILKKQVKMVLNNADWPWPNHDVDVSYLSCIL